MDNNQLDPQLGGIKNGKTSNTLEPTSTDNDVDSPWLHAPYNVVVEPLEKPGNTTISGKNYEKTYALYRSIASRTDQTEEASNLRKAWSTPPSVSIENGKLQLHGTDEFLKSDTADSLRAVFGEMKNNTYTTESLNKQIEAWNVELSKMAKGYTEALDGLNAMNYGILTTATGQPRMLTFSDFLRIANNAQVGRDANATNSDKLIFVGYEYKDDGTVEPKYVRAKDFAAEFNRKEDGDGTLLEQRMGGVRQRYSDLIAQANEGDPGAIAKLVYLQGGSEAGPANVFIDSGETFQGGTDVLVLNIMRGLTHGLDAATAWYNILFLNPMGIPRFLGKIKNVFDNGGDWSRFWDSDTVSKMADEMDATVDWYNSFFAQLSPETTKLFATTGGIVGMVAAMGYCITSANIAQEVGSAGVGRAIAAASNALETTGQGVRIAVTVGGAVGKTQQVVSQAGGMITGTGTAITGAQQVGTTLSIVLPKFVVEHFPGIAQTLVKAAYITQLGNRGAALAGAASNDIGLFVTETSPAFNALFKGAEVLPGLAGSASTAKNVLVMGKEALRNMRVWSKGFRLALNLTALGNYLAVKTLDEYFRKTNDGEDMGSLTDYLVTNVAKEAIWAAGFSLAGAVVGKIVDISHASRVAPSRVIDAAHTISDNSAGGFYQNQTSEEPVTFAQAAEAKDAADYNEIVTLFNSVITVNGEKFFVPNDVTQTVLVPTGNTIATNTGVMNGIGVVKKGSAITTRITPTSGGFNVTTITKDLATGKETSDTKFYEDFDAANNALQKATVPSVNPKTLGNSDLAVSANIAPLSIDGGLSAVRTLPDGTSRVRIRPDVLYLNPNEFENKVSELLSQFTPEQMVELEGIINTIDLDSLATAIYGGGPEVAAPSLFIPKNIEEMRQLAYNIAVGRAVAKYNGNHSVIIPTKIEADTVAVARLRRTVSERTFVGTTENNYQQIEYNPITLHTDTSSGDENSWSGDAPNGAMSYAIGQDTDYVFAEDIMTSKNIADAYRSEGKIKDYNDIIALSAFSRMYPDPINGVTMNYSDASKSAGELEEKLFRDYIQINGGAIDRNSNTFRTFAKGNTPFTKDDIHKFFETQRSFTQEPEALRNLDSFEKLMVKSYDRAVKWLRKNYNANSVIAPVDKMFELMYSARDKYTEVLRRGVAKDLKEKGKVIVTPIVVPAQLNEDKTIAFFSPANTKLASNVANGTEGDDEYLVHLPKGTKVIQYAYYDTLGRRRYEWVADISNGYVDGGRNIIDKEEGSYGPKELFVKTPDGKVYKPKSLEYDPSSYMLHSVDNRFTSSAYTQIGKDLLEPTGAVTGYADGEHNMYELTKPSGRVNNVNGFLRKYGLVEDSLANRWDMLLKNSLHNGDVTEFSATQATPGYITSTIKALAHENLNAFDNDFALTEGSELSKALDSAKHAGTDDASMFMKELEDILSTNIIQYLKDNDIKVPGDGAAKWIIGRSDDWQTILPEEVIEKTLSDVSELVARYNSKLPSGYSGVLQQIIDYGTRGSHRVKGVPMLFTHRGLNEVGNHFNRANGDLPFANAKPGDHIVSNDFMFTSFNAMTPFGYTSDAPEGAHQYVLTIGTPEGGELYYYGDRDSDFNNRIHYNDGGAAVIPIGSGMTVVSRVEITPDITWLTLVRDSKDGTPYSGPIDKDVKTIEEVNVKRRKTIDVETRTPRRYVVTENGLTKGSFSNIQEAIEYRDGIEGRQIYELDDTAPVLARPAVTSESLYSPSVRSDSAAGRAPQLAGAAEATEEAPSSGFDATEHIQKFNDLMLSLPELKDSPTDYTQAIVDISKIVRDVYNGIAADVNMEQVYEDYGRQIAEGVEQPTVDDATRQALAPLSHMLEALGRYFDPSGKSLTKGFYLPTGAPGNKLVSLEDILTNPDNVVDVDHPVDGSFDDILVDPQRVGDYGFWEKRTGELFRDENGNFTMAKAGTLEENLMAYTVSALTRGQNRLTVAANNEMAKSKYDKNRHQIDIKSALSGLRAADATRGRIRAAQLGNARSIKRSLRKEKLQQLKDDYSDENTIKAFDDAYKAKNYADEINYVKDTNEAAKMLGYRGTLTIGNIQGSTLRFGSQGGFKGITNDIRKASRINITGAKTVYRYGEYKTIGFGLSENQKADYGFVDIEPAVNLGNSVSMMFGTSRASVSLYNELLPEFQNYVQNGGWGLLNAIENFAVKNFPLIDNPHYAANELFQGLCRNLDAYTDDTARWLANQQLTAEWTKKYATANINSAIKMADLSKTDERTIDALNTIMIRALVGSPVHTSTIANGIIKSGVLATLGLNISPAIGNLVNEPIRIIDIYGHPTFVKVIGKMMNPKERGRVKDILGDLPSRFGNDSEMVGLATQAKGFLSRFIEKGEKAATWFLTASEDTKNLMFWFAAEENAKKLFPNDKNAQLRHTLRMFNETAIAGGPGTNPGISESTMGRLLFFLRNFTIRNMDDFIENFEQIGRGTSGSRKWRGRGGSQGGPNDPDDGGYTGDKGSKKFNYVKATRFAGGYLLRRYLLWLFVLAPLGRSIWDALGGDPTGISDTTNRGLYDDEGTDEYEGMTTLDNIVNYLPTGFLFGILKDFYFSARRSGIDTKNFLGIPDFKHDASLQNDLAKHLPFGVVKRRLGDMLQLLDRGYAFNAYGNKMYSAPDNIVDYMKGFMLGRATTSNAIAYNKYRYGGVDTYGDLFSGDWLDFAMGANPFGESRFDSTRSDYTGVFRGGYNDVPTMQAAIADLKERQKAIIDKYNSDLNQYTGDFEGLTKSEREKLAAEKRDQSIKEFTSDVKRLVDAYQAAGNALSDKQINSLMYLFDFKEGDDETWDSQVAQRRYVEAGLPDTNPALTSAIEKEDKTTGEKNIVEQTPFDRSLIYQNAVQGHYGRPRDAAKEITSTLESFKPTYKSYKEKVQDLNDKMYAASRGSSERKKYSDELEKVQNEYLEKLYAALDPVIRKYGTGTLSDSAALESLRSYMNGMIPYSSIKKYKLNFPSGNDVVYGQLDDWIKNRWGAAAPTSPSDKEVSDAIKRAKELKDSGKTSQAKAVVRGVLDKLARGTVSARDEDVRELRNIYYGK